MITTVATSYFCDCACTNEQNMIFATPNTEVEMQCRTYDIVWEPEVVADCENCAAMQQSNYTYI